MKKKELRQEFINFTSEMGIIFEKLNEQYFLVTEKYGEKKADLLLEGFWDTLKAGANKVNQAAKAVGSAVGKGVNAVEKGVGAVTGAGNWLWNKGVQLGQQATQAISNLATKVEGYIKDATNWIVSAPGKFMEKMTALYTDLKTNLEELKKTAGDKYQEVVNTISANIAKKIVEPLKAKWAEFQKNYAASKEAMAAKANDLKEMGNSFAKSGKESLVALGNAILKGGETAGFFAIGLVILPFYLAFKGSEALYNVGEAVVKNIKENAPEVWNTLQVTQNVKAGYNEQRPAKNESRILDFNSFKSK